MNWTDGLKWGVSAVGGVISALLGGFDALLVTLAGFCAADYATGMIKAVHNEQLSSRVAFQGGLKKLLIFVVVAVAAGLDRILDSGNHLFRGVAIGYYISAEAISIFENIAACGVPLPQKMVDMFEQANQKLDSR